jgi:hypothetical protein
VLEVLSLMARCLRLFESGKTKKLN